MEIVVLMHVVVHCLRYLVDLVRHLRLQIRKFLILRADPLAHCLVQLGDDGLVLCINVQNLLPVELFRFVLGGAILGP